MTRVKQDVLESLVDYEEIRGFDELEAETQAELRQRYDELTPRERFDRFLVWNGIIGFTDLIIKAYEELLKPEGVSVR